MQILLDMDRGTLIIIACALNVAAMALLMVRKK